MRPLVLYILSNKLARAKDVSALVTRYDKAPLEERFGCLCCPNARFQSAQKAERHLLGLLDIRQYKCPHCGKRSIDVDDDKKHQKKCPKRVAKLSPLQTSV
ncbi:hypothetical protein M408DRAFT_22255 [Serendipita vermifera MAFF 305830]|uniref:C2H2-type domain-containing protein n=1 Tax=Serendipita vermifera MAFF 305830 TaxID=933852 RepID=A0A0C3B0D4_SERVB|nr:hypothetical protein M408DRAFT_22255 [Serendipita vermifera MAFF 305830]